MRTAGVRFASLAKTVRRRMPGGLGAAAGRLRASAQAALRAYSRDEREVFALLFLPFLLAASAMGLHQSLRAIESLTAIAIPDQEVLPLAPGPTQDVRLASAPRVPIHTALPVRADLAAIRTAPESLVVARPGEVLAAAPLGIVVAAVTASDSAPRPARERAETVPPLLGPVPVSSTPAREREDTQLALLGPVGGTGRSLASRTPDPIEVLEAGENGEPVHAGVCTVAEPPRPATSTALPHGETLRPADPSTFGLRLAKAAEAQVGGLVIYNDAYRNISYPMGDVNRLFGVCTDVVVRAYRTLGLDLQALVHEARAGTGDTSIDHRRTEILRRFFAARGESLPVTTFPEDYRPGDIVTYHRPQNRGARAHIAIVSSVVAPSGRPMIVHNRGWGPELEDALFVDQITGHYRYRGPAETRNAGGNGRGAPAWAVTVPVRPAAYATERHGPEAR